jgi:hypothetical protein
MNLERVVFGFVIVMARSITISIVLKLGDRSQVGALLLASSLVADVLLITARIIWVTAENQTAIGPSRESMVNIVSLAGGALVASIVTVVILVGDTLISRR